MTIKKRSAGEAASTPKKKTKAASVPARAAGTAKKSAAAARPKIRASHAARPDAPRAPRKRPATAPAPAARRAVADVEPAPASSERSPAAPEGKASRAAPARKALLAGPKRTSKRVASTDATSPEPSSYARELALNLAAAGIDKKALGIEILDVTGRVDYADFLVVMTGRSDRHVHAIATGIEDAMVRKKAIPLSMEGLSAATWVLIDFGDVVVHVFQEDARMLYDIEGLWIDARRVPVPAEALGPGGAGASAPSPPEQR